MRDNLVGHISFCVWITNASRDKYLLIHHSLYNLLSWLGGHSDCDPNTLGVCEKEVREEGGLKNLKFLFPEIMKVDVLGLCFHYKNGLYVLYCLHFNITHPIEIDNEECSSIAPEENLDIRWMSKEEAMGVQRLEKILYVYRRLIGGIKLL